MPPYLTSRQLVRTALSRDQIKSRHDESVQKVKTTEKDRRDAYRLVEIRDHRQCRACRVMVSAFATNPARVLEHHHIRGRGFKGAESTANICLLCRSCHQDRHVKRTLTITGDANGVLTLQQGDRVWTS